MLLFDGLLIGLVGWLVGWLIGGLGRFFFPLLMNCFVVLLPRFLLSSCPRVLE